MAVITPHRIMAAFIPHRKVAILYLVQIVEIWLCKQAVRIHSTPVYQNVLFVNYQYMYLTSPAIQDNRP